MPAVAQHCRVIVAVEPRVVTITLIDGSGTRLEEERFGLTAGAADIDPKVTAVDVFSLLYQCANAAVNGGDD